MSKLKVLYHIMALMTRNCVKCLNFSYLKLIVLLQYEMLKNNIRSLFPQCQTVSRYHRDKFAPKLNGIYLYTPTSCVRKLHCTA